MAVPLIDTLADLLSATSGALVGAIVTGLFNRSRRREMTNQIIENERQIEAQQLENERLLDLIKEKENIILELQVKKARTTFTKKRRK